MLEYMRKNANSSVVWFIIGAIALVFIFFGVGGGGRGYKSITVNGEEISPVDYDRMVQRLNRDRGGEIEPGQESALRRAAVFNLINLTLMRQFGQNLGLTPTDQAVAAQISSDPVFQTDGRFDKKRYEAMVKSNPVAYEEEQRKQLLLTGVDELVSGLISMQKPEVVNLYRLQEDQVAVEYAFFPSEGLKSGLVPTDEQLNDYYLNHQEDWRFKTTMKLEYVELKPADFLDQVQMSDDELQAIYNDNIERFQVDDSAEVSHILFRFPTMNPTEEEKKSALDKAQAAFARAGKEDFAALAREVSEDPTSAAEGGVVGSISRNSFFPDFEKAAFEAPLNEVTEPVESPIGYHLIKVTARQMAGVKPFEEVRDTLAEERRAFKAREAAVARLEDLLLRTETNPKLADAAKTMDLETKVTDMFTEDAPPEFFEGDAEAIKRAFKAPVGRVAFPVEQENHLVVFVPVERIESAIPPLDEIKDKVVADWTSAEALRLVQLDAAHFIQRANADWGQALAELPAKAAVTTGRSPLASRAALPTTDPALNGLDYLSYMTSICTVAKPGLVSPLPVAGKDAEGRDGVFVLRLADFKAADESLLSGAMLDSYIYMMMMSKRAVMHQAWAESLYQASSDKIVVPDFYMN